MLHWELSANITFLPQNNLYMRDGVLVCLLIFFLTSLYRTGGWKGKVRMLLLIAPNRFQFRPVDTINHPYNLKDI